MGVRSLVEMGIYRVSGERLISRRWTQMGERQKKKTFDHGIHEKTRKKGLNREGAKDAKRGFFLVCCNPGRKTQDYNTTKL